MKRTPTRWDRTASNFLENSTFRHRRSGTGQPTPDFETAPFDRSGNLSARDPRRAAPTDGAPLFAGQAVRSGRSRSPRRPSMAFAPKIRFAPDSPLEGRGFEPSVPPQDKRRSRDNPFRLCGTSRSAGRPTRFARGTGSSNPPRSSAESAANFVFGREAWKGPRRRQGTIPTVSTSSGTEFYAPLHTRSCVIVRLFFVTPLLGESCAIPSLATFDESFGFRDLGARIV
jgi:hypothetical protein